MPRRADMSSFLIVALFGAVPAVQPAWATSYAPAMFGAWGMVCPHPMGGTRHCTIRYQAPGNRPGFGIDFEVFLDESRNSRLSTTGWSRATCQRIALSEDLGRYYRLVDATIPLWRMEDHADRLLDAMRSHIPSFGDCPRQGGDSEAYAEALLDGQEADFTRALIAAETWLRGRGPDSNDGVTTSANLAGVAFRGPQASIDQVARVAAELDWSIDGRTRQSLTVMPPPNYAPGLFDMLLARLDSLSDLDIRLLGPYGPARVPR